MKLSILLGSTLLFATVLSPMSAYADDQNLQCRRLGNGCDSHNGNGNGKLSISGFDIEVKSSDRGNTVDRNIGTRNAVASTVSVAGADHPDTNDTDNVDAGNNDVGNENTDTGGGNNTNPPQHNSDHIKGYDPFTDGLYGPGT